MEYTLLFNPYAGGGQGTRRAQALEILHYGEIKESLDMTQISDWASFFAERPGRGFILCGGDGTLNRFLWNTQGTNLPRNLYYCAAGTGNDFLRDIGSGENELVPLTPYLQKLPLCLVQGQVRPFLNGVGYGIDGFCCEEGDRLRELSDAPISYTRIALSGLLGRFSPVTATVFVDGRMKRFQNVWIAATMKGRYYGGGMMAAPQQDRRQEDGTLSLLIFHGTNRLQTLAVFPKIFSGEHVKSDACTILTGRDITVLFDRPTPLQIDGETFRNVTEYRAIADASLLEAEA